MKDLEYNETPVIEINHPLLKEAGIQLLVKREDLNHPLISGNKWWKLKYNLKAAVEQNFDTVLTFGGAFSNHIYATAAACREVDLKSIGIIRGERHYPLNPTLSFAQSSGMDLHYVARSTYRLKNEQTFLQELENQFGKFFFVPEGGTNDYGIKGAQEFVTKISPLFFDIVFVPVGTAGTITGIIAGMNGKKKIIGIPVLKAAEFQKSEIINLLQNFCNKQFNNWMLLTEYHHGGYAKTTGKLMEFILMMRHQHNLPLDQVYTGKLIYAIFEEVKKGSFSRGTTILALHTGGLQGLRSLDFSAA
jgi:1-aminocyclopropane-1-carboxylate deaminase